MKKVSFKMFRSQVVDSFEDMNAQEEDFDIYSQEEVDSIRNAESFSELAEILVDFEYWEMCDVVDFSRNIL